VTESGNQSQSAPRVLHAIIVRNSLVATAGTISLRVLNFVSMLAVARLLGDVGLGQYSTVFAFVGLFGVFFELGMFEYVQREIARDHARVRVLFGNLVLLRLLLAFAGCLLITGLAAFVGYEAVQITAVFLLTATFLFAAILAPLQTLFFAHERFGPPITVSVIGQLLVAILNVALLLLGGGLLSLFLVGFIVMPIQIAILISEVRKLGVRRADLRASPGEWPSMIRAGLPFALTSLALNYTFGFDIVILGFFREDAVVGWYNAAYRLVFTLVGLASGFLAAVGPSLARQYGHDAGEVHTWVRSSVRWMAFFLLPMTVGVSVLSPQIIAVLYGSAFQPSAGVLALICWDVPFLMFNTLSNNIVVAAGLERLSARIFLTSLLLNVALNLLLIPTFGMYGAAAATVLTDGLTAVRFSLLLHQRMALGMAAGPVFRTALGAGLMGAGVWLVQGLPLPVTVVCGAAMFLALAFVLKLVDVSVLYAQVQRLPGVIRATDPQAYDRA
jgi:O-antigen/teichoic acid export membrane protein